MRLRFFFALAALSLGAFTLVQTPSGTAATFSFTPTDDGWIESAAPDAKYTNGMRTPLVVE